jgi:hypothetical protein
VRSIVRGASTSCPKQTNLGHLVDAIRSYSLLGSSESALTHVPSGSGSGDMAPSFFMATNLALCPTWRHLLMHGGTAFDSASPMDMSRPP